MKDLGLTATQASWVNNTKLSDAIHERTIALENLIQCKAVVRDLVEQLLDDSLLESINHTVIRDSLHSRLRLVERYQVEWLACCEKVTNIRYKS